MRQLRRNGCDWPSGIWPGFGMRSKRVSHGMLEEGCGVHEGAAENEGNYDAAEIDRELIASRLQQDVVIRALCFPSWLIGKAGPGARSNTPLPRVSYLPAQNTLHHYAFPPPHLHSHEPVIIIHLDETRRDLPVWPPFRSETWASVRPRSLIRSQAGDIRRWTQGRDIVPRGE